MSNLSTTEWSNKSKCKKSKNEIEIAIKKTTMESIKEKKYEEKNTQQHQNNMKSRQTNGNRIPNQKKQSKCEIKKKKTAMCKEHVTKQQL